MTQPEIDCLVDFYLNLSHALSQSGGDNSTLMIEKYKDMKLSEIATVLAPNGIRMVYYTQCHVDYKKDASK